MKKFFLLALLSLGFCGANAQTYNYLVVADQSGKTTDLPVSDITITFADGNLVAKTADDNVVTLPLASLDKMYFSTTATGIATVTNGLIAAEIVDGHLKVSAPAGTKVAVYGTDGRQLSVSGRLAPGAYIVNVGGQTFKLLAR